MQIMQIWLLAWLAYSRTTPSHKAPALQRGLNKFLGEKLDWIIYHGNISQAFTFDHCLYLFFIKKSTTLYQLYLIAMCALYLSLPFFCFYLFLYFIYSFNLLDKFYPNCIDFFQLLHFTALYPLCADGAVKNIRSLKSLAYLIMSMDYK